MARPDFRKRGYHSEWDALARRFKELCPLCLGCWAVSVQTPTTVADHLVPLVVDPSGLLDITNLQPSCTWHHHTCKRHLELRWKLKMLSLFALRLDSPSAIEYTLQNFPVPIDVHGYPALVLTRSKQPYPFAFGTALS
jgi:hypothetical protein